MKQWIFNNIISSLIIYDDDAILENATCGMGVGPMIDFLRIEQGQRALANIIVA